MQSTTFQDCLFLTACSEGQIELADSLLKAGVSIVICLEPRRWTGLHLAVGAHSLEMADFLLSKYPQLIQYGDDQRATALHHAVRLNDLKMVNFLLSRGACARDRMNRGWTPVHLAAKEGYLSILSALITSSLGARLDLTDQKHSVINIARHYLRHDIVVYLRELEASLMESKSHLPGLVRVVAQDQKPPSLDAPPKRIPSAPTKCKPLDSLIPRPTPRKIVFSRHVKFSDSLEKIIIFNSNQAINEMKVEGARGPASERNMTPDLGPSIAFSAVDTVGMPSAGCTPALSPRTFCSDEDHSPQSGELGSPLFQQARSTFRKQKDVALVSGRQP